MALRLNVDVPTPDGWKKLFEIKSGDMVFAPDGGAVEVTRAALAQGRDCWKVAVGSECFVTDDEHQWLVDAPHGPSVMSTEQLYESLRNHAHSIAGHPVVAITQTASVSLKTIRVDGGYYLAGRGTLPVVAD